MVKFDKGFALLPFPYSCCGLFTVQKPHWRSSKGSFGKLSSWLWFLVESHFPFRLGLPRLILVSQLLRVAFANHWVVRFFFLPPKRMGLNGRHMTWITDFFTKKKMFPKKFETPWELRNFQLMISLNGPSTKFPPRHSVDIWNQDRSLSGPVFHTSRVFFGPRIGGMPIWGFLWCNFWVAKHDVYKLKKDLNLKHNCLKTWHSWEVAASN